MNMLYIIGNGFDLWHGLPTSYKCFNCYIHRTHPREHEIIGHIFNHMDPNDLWSDFENKLGTPDIGSLVDYICNKEAKKCVEKSLDNVFFSLKDLFKEWVEQIPMLVFNNRFLKLDKRALFLNFNYTNTLERLYNIDSGRICYIHGNTKNNKLCNPVFGHRGCDNFVENNKRLICDKLSSNTRVSPCEIINGIKDFYDSLAKEPKIISRKSERDEYGHPDNYYIFQNKNFFNNVNGCSDIYVLGHSLNEIDTPYFVRIYASSPNATWHVSCYDEKEKKNNKQKLCDLLAVSQKNINIELFELDDLELKKENC